MGIWVSGVAKLMAVLPPSRWHSPPMFRRTEARASGENTMTRGSRCAAACVLLVRDHPGALALRLAQFLGAGVWEGVCV